MTATARSGRPPLAQERDTSIENLLNTTVGVWQMFTLYLGIGSGHFQARADGAARTPTELSNPTCTVERFARERLEQQFVHGPVKLEISGRLPSKPLGATDKLFETGLTLRGEGLRPRSNTSKQELNA